MSYIIRANEMRDDWNGRYNYPWELGTLRVYHRGEERYKWSVSEPGDEWYGTAMTWSLRGGEIFDGKVWRPLGEWVPVFESKTSLKPIRVEQRVSPSEGEDLNATI